MELSDLNFLTNHDLQGLISFTVSPVTSKHAMLASTSLVQTPVLKVPPASAVAFWMLLQALSALHV